MVTLYEPDIPDGITVLAATTGAQVSGALEENEHERFTYYALKDLVGNTDNNKDRLTIMTELNNFFQASAKE